jgi:4-amino-4-deoxychorismate lyase
MTLKTLSDGPDVVLVDGRPARGLSPLDRGLHFGDGLFETIACRRGRARFLALHLDRLMQGCERLAIEPAPVAAIRGEIEQLALRTDAAIIKLIVTRGQALARGYAPAGGEGATRIALRYPWPHEESGSWQAGVRAGIASLRLGENAALAGMKHLNRLEQVLAQSERDSRQVRELLLFGSSGRLVSGTMSNVFIVRQGKLETPRIDLCGVAGVMRRVVLREARRAGIAVEECDIAAPDLAQAQEIFLTNARIGIWPVNALEKQDLPVGPITQRLQSLIAPMLEDPVDA